MMARAPWETHRLMSEIFRLIVGEYLGHSVGYTDISGTTGSYRDLSMSTYDINVELWESAAPAERQQFMVAGTANDAGALDYAPVTRSGIYLRPSAADRAELLSKARFYSALESEVMPRIPPLARVLTNCAVADGERCLDVINARCATGTQGLSMRENATLATRCKPIVKEIASYDPGAVEKMIRDGDLPLSIAYMGVDGTEAMLSNTPDETVLFYWWEPSGLINNQSDFIRVYFDAPVACPAPGMPHTSRSLYPPHAACDFELGKPHKGYSTRLARQGVNDAVGVLRGLNMDADAIAVLLAHARDLSDDDALGRTACEWVLTHQHVWRTWLRPIDRITDSDLSRDPSFYSLGVGLLLLLTVFSWLCTPLCIRRRNRAPTPGQTWETWSNYPGLGRRLCGCLARMCRPYRTKVMNTTTMMMDKVEGIVEGTLSDLLEPGSVIADPLKTVGTSIRGFLRMARVAPKGRFRSSLKHALPDQLANGIQFSAQRVYGLEGSTISVLIVRHDSRAAEAVSLRVWGQDTSAHKLCAETVEKLDVRLVQLDAGQTHCEVVVKLERAGNPMSISKGLWMPELAFDLHLDEANGNGDAILGKTHVCTVTVIDTDDWPTPGACAASKSRTFYEFAKRVILDNKEDQLWWLIGTTVRAVHAYILDPLILRSLLDDAIGNADVQRGLNLAIFKVALLLVDQYTYFHYNSNCRICAYSPIQWILYKWQSLPLDMQLDHEIHD